MQEARLSKFLTHPWRRLLIRGLNLVHRYVFAASIALGLTVGLACDRFTAERCAGDACFFSKREWLLLGSLTGVPEAPPDPSNKYALDPAAAALGHAFFFDPKFSGFASQVDRLDRPKPYARAPKGQAINISCASCHNPARAAIDDTSTPRHVAIGAGWHYLNATSLMNTAHWQVYSLTGRADSLWDLGMAVITGVAMGSNRIHVARRVMDAYRAEYEALFPEYPLPLSITATDGDPGKKPGCQAGDATEPFGDAFDCLQPAEQEAVTRTCVNWAKAIAAYEYLLRSDHSLFDLFMAEGPDSPRLSAAEKRGAKLFVGKANCVDCHSGPLLTDQGFHNIGVPQLGDAVPTEAECVAGSVCDCVNGTSCLPWGEYEGLQRLQNADRFRRDSKWSDDPGDASRAAIYETPLDDTMKGRWRTPSLRDIALTAPYMHDGIYETLDDVVWHYHLGGAPSGPFAGEIDPLIAPLHLSAQEQADLVAFLQTLTGEPLPKEIAQEPVLPP